MQISEAVEVVGLSAKTIRYYEAEGVIPEARRLPNGYRVYDDRDLRRLRTVAAARALDLSLDDIRELIELASSGHRPCPRLRTVAEQRRDLVRQAINDLVALEERLTETIERSRQVDENRSLEPSTICPVLEAANERNG